MPLSCSGQHSSSITKQRSEGKWHTHSDRDGDPTTFGSGCVHTHAHTHTDPWTPCGTTARSAIRTLTESDGQISNRRLLTKRLSPWQEKCVQLWVVEFTAGRWGRGKITLCTFIHLTLLLTIPVLKVKVTYLCLYMLWLCTVCTPCPSMAMCASDKDKTHTYIKHRCWIHLLSFQVKSGLLCKKDVYEK